MDTDERWEHWAETMRIARDPLSAAEALAAVAGEVGAALVHERPLAREWAVLGLSVEQRPLATSGLCVRGTRRVLVRRRDSLTRRRYTVAHELGHLLLAQATDAGRLVLSSRLEEQLCERFASLALIPRERLRAYVEAHPPLPHVAWLRKAAEHFRVSLSPLVIALGELPSSDGSTAFLLARLAPHRLRPKQVALRIAHSCCPPHIRLPSDKRLVSLGWHDLCRWAGKASPGNVRCMRDTALEFEAGPGAPSGTSSYRGSVDCEAIAIAGDYRLVVAFEMGTLVAWRRPQRRRRSFPAAPADQLALALP